MKNNPIPVIALVIVAVALAVFAFLFLRQENEDSPTDSQTVCTLEAKICPDGSYVGRTGPNCEFAPCPESNEEVEFDAAFIYKTNWPPVVKTYALPEGATFACDATARTFTRDGSVVCVSETTEAAAGSVYTTYTFSTRHLEEVTTAEFTLQFPTCQNYEELQQSDCEQERADVNIDDLGYRVLLSQ